MFTSFQREAREPVREGPHKEGSMGTKGLGVIRILLSVTMQGQEA